MMNYVWPLMILTSFVFAVINGSMEELSSAVLQGAADAVSFCIKLLGTVCLWNGLMEIAKKSSLTQKIEKLKADTEYILEIKAYGFWKNYSEKITKEFKTK